MQSLVGIASNHHLWVRGVVLKDAAPVDAVSLLHTCRPGAAQSAQIWRPFCCSSHSAGTSQKPSLVRDILTHVTWLPRMLLQPEAGLDMRPGALRDISCRPPLRLTGTVLRVMCV